LYRYARNPIYIAVFLVLAGHSLWHPARPILWMLPIVAACSHLFVVLYEEPVLRRTFGGQYEAYSRQVPRWLPRLPKAG
jgi:protein-S-isoprenylcysteine O-methyltransferase Ste14